MSTVQPRMSCMLLSPQQHLVSASTAVSPDVACAQPRLSPRVYPVSIMYVAVPAERFARGPGCMAGVGQGQLKNFRSSTNWIIISIKILCTASDLYPNHTSSWIRMAHRAWLMLFRNPAPPQLCCGPKPPPLTACTQNALSSVSITCHCLVPAVT